MTDSVARWARVQEIFHTALERTSSDRDAFLREACSDDGSLRAEVDSLLLADGAAGAFAERPAIEALGPLELRGSADRQLQPGDRLGVYTIEGWLGAGGMGEVYRARDGTLGRDVALKLLPRIFDIDPERRARFEREARLLAALNHPHIGAIYGVVDSDGIRALVLELVDGGTLADRLAQGPIPIGAALPIARQIAEALEAAHEKGIVHRDLKPANIKITPDGSVKVLDFGLAKVASGEASGPDLTHSPTRPEGGTRDGVLLGTAPYMSPGQVRGRPVDKRADVWAFGCVLYEMLTGRLAFPGDTLSDTVASILQGETDWRALPESTPDSIRRLLRRCLEKDPTRRLRDIGDARIEIEDVLSGASPTSAATTIVTPPQRFVRLAWSIATVASLVAFIAVGVLTSNVRMLRGAQSVATPADAVYRSTILLPGNLGNPIISAGTRLALSPDGRHLAFVTTDANSRALLWVRRLDSLLAQPLPGTEGAASPFWSPDGRFLAFYAGGKLKKIDASGGPVMPICDAAFPGGGTWSRADVILFTSTPPNNPGLISIARVPATGGTPVPVTTIGVGESAHLFPSFLPDDRHFLFVVAAGSDVSRAEIGSLDSPEKKPLLDDVSLVRYTQGFLVFSRGSSVMSQPFDPVRLSLTGQEAPEVEQVQLDPVVGTGTFSTSDTGVLVYQGGASAGGFDLVSFDRNGNRLGTLGAAADYEDLELAPDGLRASVSLPEGGSSNRHIWIFDVVRGLPTQLTFGDGSESNTIWSPDGSRIIFSSRRNGRMNLYQKASNGAGAEDLVLENDADKRPLSWSQNGQFMMYVNTLSADLWALPCSGPSSCSVPSGGRKPFPFIKTPDAEVPAQFSPDGRWVAYGSNESRTHEVYVTPFPGPGGKWRVSTDGGFDPRWNDNGKEIFYLARNNKLMAAAVTAVGDRFEVGAVTALFDLPKVGPRWTYDVAPGGKRFLAVTTKGQGASAPLTLVVNWTASLRK